MFRFVRYIYYLMKYHHLIQRKPALFENINNILTIANTPLKVYALCQVAISRPMEHEVNEDYHKSPSEVADTLISDKYEEVEFMAYLLNRNGYKVNLLAANSDLRTIEDRPEKYLCVVKPRTRNIKKFYYMGPEDWVWGCKPDFESVVKAACGEIKPFIVYDHTGEQRLLSYLPGNPVPYRMDDEAIEGEGGSLL